MNKDSKIFVAGGTGMVGSAIIKNLIDNGYTNIISNYHTKAPFLPVDFVQLDLTKQLNTEIFFQKERPEYVFLAAAKVGGILVNRIKKAEFIYDNLTIATNVIHAAYKTRVKKLLNLGSSCIFPKNCSQPMKEGSLLTGKLETTNEAYAIAKIAAIKLCKFYNEQYKTNFISVMPPNLYGKNDNFNLETSHVLPALIRKIHLSKLYYENDFDSIKRDFLVWGNNEVRIDNKIIKINNKSPIEEVMTVLNHYNIYKNHIIVWGTGESYREFLYVDDLADACLFLMQNYDYLQTREFINAGTNKDITIQELVFLIYNIIDYVGEIFFDKSMPDGTLRKLLDSTEINSLGWKAKTVVGDGIKKTYKWYLTHTKTVGDMLL